MAKNKNIFVTITGFQHYYGREPFQIGNLIRCAKEPGNPYDSDAIRAFLPYIGKVGYIANSPQTKAGGTESASRIYERVPKRFYVRVLFTTCTKIICRVEFGDMSDLKQAQEFNSLRHIPDSFKKIVIVNGVRKPWRNDEGFVIMGMKYFLLNADSLEF